MEGLKSIVVYQSTRLRGPALAAARFVLRPLGMRGRMAIPCMFFAGCVIGGGPMVSVGRYGPRLGGQGGLGVSDGAQSVRLDVGGTYLLERSRRDVLVAITGRLLLDPAVQAQPDHEG